jgi:PPOX class probable FMN-dependent enzyme
MTRHRSVEVDEVQVSDVEGNAAIDENIGRFLDARASGDEYRITTVAQLRELVPPPPPGGPALEKDIDYLDAHCRAFISRSPFLVMATADAEGTCGATPKGGPPGFVRVLDEHRLVIPDYPGNGRLDGIRDALTNPRGHLLFFLPGRDETLRVSGDVWISNDPDLLAAMSDCGKVPRLGIGFTVHTAFLQCAKALKRSALWRPAEWLDITDVPSSAQMFKDHIAMDMSVDDIERVLEEQYRDTLY